MKIKSRLNTTPYSYFFLINHILSTHSLWKCLEISLQDLDVDIRAKTIDKK